MSDNSYPGPMTMVKIDGAKIKSLREQQGLTQLYLATAVGVTTDTISRWENKRYPSIKKENGLKLAEALHVTLGDFSQQEETTETQAEIQESNSNHQKAEPLTHPKKVWPILILAFVLFSIIAAFGYYYLRFTTVPIIQATRILPSHVISGQPIPVVIKISGTIQQSTGLIVKEILPPGSIVLSTFPKISSNNLKNNTIKWISRIDGDSSFSYLVQVSGVKNDEIQFSGSTSISGDNTAIKEIEGNMATKFDEYHWADSDRNNMISDDEILTVYDQFNEIEGLGLEIDRIEELWLGSGYSWDKDLNQFIIHE